jgi:hypothetical protein
MDGTPFFTELPGSDIGDGFYSLYYAFASFDGTTNAPTVYPDGTSIQNTVNEVLVQVTTTPGGPLVGNTEAGYTVRFNATGGAFVPLYTWSATGLPPGLSITSNADSSATLSGTPTVPGSYSFTLTLTDSLGRSAEWTYPITIQ